LPDKLCATGIGTRFGKIDPGEREKEEAFAFDDCSLDGDLEDGLGGPI